MPTVLAQLPTGQTVCVPFEVMMTGTATQAIVWTTATSNSTATTIWPGCASNTICTPTTGDIYWAAPELVIDEEDYVNNAEYYELARQRGVAFRIRTAEERQRADEELARARAAAEAAKREREAADLRARELLFRHLTAEQRRTVEKNKWFVVVGGKSGTEYRIRTDMGVAGNIRVMRGESVEATLCCHCSPDIPAPDQWLAQKIALQWDEESFLKTANRRAA